MAFKAYDTKSRNTRGIRKVNQHTVCGRILVKKGEPCLLVDGVFYHIPFTKSIASKVHFIVNTDLNPKSISTLIKPNTINIESDRFDKVALIWSYVYSGQKVKCNKIDDGYVVNLDHLNTIMKKEYDTLVDTYPNYSKLTYISDVKLLR